MGDFFLDFRDAGARSPDGEVEAALRFFPDQRVSRIEGEGFRLTLTSSDREELWAPYVSPADGVVIAISGRVALDPEQWAAARGLPGPGGLASKAVYHELRRDARGFAAALNGNFIVHVWDPRTRDYTIVTDPSGTALTYGLARDPDAPAALCSHPDALAQLTGVREALDEVSLAEFLIAGKLSAPFTYYAGVRAWSHGTLHRISLTGGSARVADRSPTRSLAPQPSDADEASLALELADAFRRATRRRTAPELGRSLLALSGGLDSRMILSLADSNADLIAFSCLDRENYEVRTARAIARKLGRELVPLTRSADFYGEHAELGVRISGGMGDLASNHFIGFRSQLRDLGMQNLVTGCYCDYLFKSLALDKSVAPFSQRESLGPFKLESYLPHFAFDTALAQRVSERLDATFPQSVRGLENDAQRLDVASRRIFPLQYEGDNLERVTAHRVLGWSPPAVDNDVLDVFRRVSARGRLNKALFTRAVLAACPPALCRIPDANTTLPVGAAWPLQVLGRYRIALRRRFERMRPMIASQESWPNWSFYLTHSASFARIWGGTRDRSGDFFRDLLGSGYREQLAGYQQEHGAFRGTALAIRLLTLKIWFQQR